MAKIVPYKNKDGKIVSYQIQVPRAYDEKRASIKPYTLSWKIPDNFKSEKAIEKELLRVAGEFESKCRQGQVSADKRTFQEFSEYFMTLVEQSDKNKTYVFYEGLLTRINKYIGDIKMKELTTAHLNTMYIKMSKETSQKNIRCYSSEQLLKIINERKITRQALSDQTRLALNTVSNAVKGKKIAKESAQIICRKLIVKYNDVFIDIPAKPLSSKTILHHHKLVHTILEQALREDVVIKNVSNAVKKPRSPKKEATFFEVDEILKIKDALDKEPLKWKVPTYLMIYTGARRGEILGLRWKSVYFDDNEIKIENNLQYTSKTGIYDESPKEEDFRTISVPPLLMDMLKELKEVQDILKDGIPGYEDHGYCFARDNGLPLFPDSINSFLTSFSERNGFSDIHPHKFRHSQASILFGYGLDEVTVSKRLGHKQVSTTKDLYSHMLKQNDRKATDILTNLLN
ncbi:MAG: site-specific integrase [Lachnospiraceae bacterium]|nr:site-specific integrase [Lachnospiraceae bacterium]